ncbi:IclR family transcriptional regulator [Pseudarthrobacter sp. R1]|uniref:IclR family transcriptional regulator n=1 Tax=Pseudarthrobacter sp. R1 TaxID=2944934 RepID=UPI00210AA3FA|nr:IclR family transcriptional regulator [Pseudarthrobacter sp. R1]MCQ6272314.1 IclR family transcriptional regulator [Pseudarthrobacter sp. R1]
MTDFGEDEPRSQTRIQSVSRAMSLLIEVAESTEGLTARELADRFGLSLATTYHLLTTLWADGLLSKEASRVYRLGPRAATLAEAYMRLDTVPREYRDILHAVAGETGETAYLGVWSNNSVRVLDRVDGAHSVRVVGLSEGYAEDIHARASGKLLMAFMQSEEQRSIVDRLRLRRRTPHTITKKSDLFREFEDIRERGLSFDREEFEIGVKCVSAPIWRGDTVVACITVSLPAQRFDSTQNEVIKILKRALGTSTPD